MRFAIGLLCRLIGHTPNRARVWHDGLSYRCRCTRCGRPMLRVTSQWMLFTTRHYSLKRGAHPNFDQDD